MDIFDQRSLALIPQPIRWVVLAFLALATLLSAGFAIWLTVAHGSDSLAVALLSIFKASAIGTALWFFFLIGQRAQSRADLLRRTSRILTDQIPASLHIYGKPDELEGVRNRGATPDDKPGRVDVEVDHAPGTVHARYIITWPGLRDRLQLRVHLNVKVLSVVYFFPSGDLGRLEKTFEGTLTASRNMGWKVEYKGIQSQRHVHREDDFAELWLRQRLSADFLHESTEQLFVTNDLAAMTRAIMLSWSRRGEILGS